MYIYQLKILHIGKVTLLLSKEISVLHWQKFKTPNYTSRMIQKLKKGNKSSLKKLKSKNLGVIHKIRPC